MKQLGFLHSTGVEGVKALRTQPDRYALVLMDIQMPEMDGLTATRRIREVEKSTGDHAIIIAITANALMGELERCLAAGMDDYISKPVKLNTLGQTLSRWQPTAQQELST